MKESNYYRVYSAGGIGWWNNYSHVVGERGAGRGWSGLDYERRGKNETLGPGIHFVHPMVKVKTYPISQQQLVLSNNPGITEKEEHADWHVGHPHRQTEEWSN